MQIDHAFIDLQNAFFQAGTVGLKFFIELVQLCIVGKYVVLDSCQIAVHFETDGLVEFLYRGLHSGIGRDELLIDLVPQCVEPLLYKLSAHSQHVRGMNLLNRLCFISCFTLAHTESCIEKTLTTATASESDCALFSRSESRWKKRAEYAKNSSTLS